jgi:type I restriction enzyme S subunit
MTTLIKPKYNTIELGEATDLIIDYRGKTPKKLGGDWSTFGVPAFSAMNIKDGRIVKKGSIRYVSDSLYEKWMKEKPEKGDILLTSEAPLGELYKVKNSEKFVLSQRLFSIRTKKEILNPDFLYYYLKSPYGQSRLTRRATGTTVLGIRQAELVKVEIDLPELKSQKEIANILSAYDDLIDNNEKRIDLLETITRNLYVEYFIKKDDKKTSGDIDSIAIVYRGKSYSSEDIAGINGIPFVNLKCMNRNGGFRYDGLKSFSGGYKENHVVKNGDMVMAVTDMTQDRAIVARTARIPILDGGFGVISMDLVKIEPKDGVDKTWLYSFLRYSDFGNSVKEYANGANVLHLNPARISEYKLDIPSIGAQKGYSEITESMFDLQDKLSAENRRLQEARDLLIPQLVGGNLEIKTYE